MNTGLAILIARTKTHPEEFIGYFPSDMSPSKWVIAIENFQQHMTEEEKFEWDKAKEWLDEWHKNKQRDEFTEFVMKKLAGVGDDDGVALSSKTHPPSMGALRINPSSMQYEVWDGSQWIETNQSQQALRNSYQNNPYQGMGQQGLRVSTQTDDSNSLYSVPSLQKASEEGNLLSQIAKRMGRK
jgi:hypothetical protein